MGKNPVMHEIPAYRLIAVREKTDFSSGIRFFRVFPAGLHFFWFRRPCIPIRVIDIFKYFIKLT